MLSLSLSLNTQVRAATLTISIASGGGYAGSVYRASRAGGQWHADGTPIAGAFAQEWTMTLVLEGAAITYRIGGETSNAIEMWMPTDLPQAYKTNGGWWDAKRDVTVVNGKVASVADQFGVRPMTQPTVASQPDYAASLPDGGPAMVWPDTANTRYLAPPAAFAPAYWIFVLRYRDGLVGTFPNDSGMPEGDYPCVISSGSSPNRVMGERGTANLFSTLAWAATASKNGAEFSANLLPLPKSILEVQGTPTMAVWSLGRGSAQIQDDPAIARGWRGPIYEVITLGAAPDDAIRRRLQGYLAWRNGAHANLPVGHAYFSSAPRN